MSMLGDERGKSSCYMGDGPSRGQNPGTILVLGDFVVSLARRGEIIMLHMRQTLRRLESR